MGIFGTSGPNTDYGIEVTFTDRRKGKKRLWFGSDSVKRDSEHNKWAARSDVMVVQDIKRNK